jgi:hypothetical protein
MNVFKRIRQELKRKSWRFLMICKKTQFKEWVELSKAKATIKKNVKNNASILITSSTNIFATMKRLFYFLALSGWCRLAGSTVQPIVQSSSETTVPGATAPEGSVASVCTGNNNFAFDVYRALSPGRTKRERICSFHPLVFPPRWQ